MSLAARGAGDEEPSWALRHRRESELSDLARSSLRKRHRRLADGQHLYRCPRRCAIRCSPLDQEAARHRARGLSANAGDWHRCANHIHVALHHSSAILEGDPRLRAEEGAQSGSSILGASYVRVEVNPAVALTIARRDS